jgi:Restriction endonuclease
MLQVAPASGNLTRSDQLHTTDLEAMTPETWHLFATWLLERMGYTTERSESNEHGSRFFGHLGDREFVASALRLPKGAAISKVEIQSVAALAAGSPDRQVLLLTTSVAGKEARAAADGLGVTLLEQTELDVLLEQLEVAHMREVAAEAQAAEERALRAEAIRTAVLSLVDQMEDALARAVNTRKTGTRAALLESVEHISAGTAICTQAFVAWETLATDWSAAFGEHEGRDGSLLITADPATLDEIGERAQHLAAVTLQALVQVQDTPGAGELGYTAWRKAVMEELLARCDAIRCRFDAILPTAWQDYSKACDTVKLQQAEEATIMATYARGRAEKALAQLQTRARIAVTR